LATIHRAENTDNPKRLQSILKAFNNLDEALVFPVHPRTRKILQDLGYVAPDHVRLIDPIGYVDMVRLEGSARMILTDSGGIQKEAYWLGVPCVTLRDETEWVETVENGWNCLTGPNPKKIIQAVNSFKPPIDKPFLYGQGTASQTIIQKLEEYQT
jgi:UDP-N-acetylglucosamine 2-epimerase